MTYFTNDMISCLPLYNNVNFFFVVFLCHFFLGKTNNKEYSMEKNTLCLNNMKNLSLWLEQLVHKVQSMLFFPHFCINQEAICLRFAFFTISPLSIRFNSKNILPFSA